MFYYYTIYYLWLMWRVCWDITIN